MKALLDIGNTRSKYVLLEQGKLSAIHYLETCQLTPTWLSANFTGVSHCVVANVAQEDVSQVIRHWCQQHHIDCQLLQSEAQNFGIRCAYQEPQHFGVDRWLALVGTARQFKNQDCLIIDAGTATTLDVLSANGQHLGGWIFPGIDLLFNSLLVNTENISAQAQVINKVVLADNTSDAVNQGSWAATLGLINSSKQVCQHEHGISEQQLKIIITGGNAQQLAKLYPGKAEVVNNLLFIGMQAYC